MKTFKNPFGYLAIAATAFVLAFTACEDDTNSTEEDDEEETGTQYIIGASVDDDASYLVVTDDLLEDTITIVGNGYESSSYGDLTYGKDGYVYFLNNDELLIDQFEVNEDGITKIASISYDALVPGAYFRYIQVTDDDYLMLLSTVDENSTSPYVVIKVPDFTVESYGNFDVPYLAGDTATWLNGKVIDDRIYLGMMYGDYFGFDNLPDSLVTVIYDFPSFTNSKTIVTDVTAGSAAGYRSNPCLVDEDDVIYQYNLNANVWNSTESNNTMPDGFVRIVDEAYDDDYFFNITEHFDEPIAIWNAWYASDGIAYANIVKESDVTAWRGWSGDYSILCKIDLYNQTVTELNVPSANLVDLFQLTAGDDEYFYIPICPTDGDANIYQITVGGGADDYEVGTSLDDGNVFVNSLIKND